jgi:DNA-binding MarR family transcriptional regulator
MAARKRPGTKARRSTAVQGIEIGVLDEFVGYRLRVAQLLVYADFIGGQKRSVLTPGQFAMLVMIEANPEITQQRLCDALGIDKSTLAVALHKLVARGLIRRVRSKVDRRHNVLQLTAKGATGLVAMTRYVRAHEKKIAARLSVSERSRLMELLDKLG